MFPSRVSAPVPSTPTVEDIFSSALSNLFTDDTQNSHGVPGQSVYYDSPRFGRISLRIPAHPDVEEGRKLFAHYLWNAGVIVADAIESASASASASTGHNAHDSASASAEVSQDDNQDQTGVEWNNRYWDVRGRRTLELGAGTALPSLISALSGAKSVTITDHPSSPALTMGAIEQNVRDNLHRSKAEATTTEQNVGDNNLDVNKSRPDPTPEPVSREQDTTGAGASSMAEGSDPKSKSNADSPCKCKIDAEISVHGYTWGTSTFYLPSSYGKLAPSQPQAFDRLIIADCLWMPSQHANLCKTILHYLDRSDSDSCALVVAGFHTGRSTVRNFFEVATGDYKVENENQEAQHEGEDEGEDEETRAVKGRLRAAEIFEIDTNGVRRPWEPVRPKEDKHMTKRWCVCAVLVRR